MPVKMQPTSVIKARLGIDANGKVQRTLTHSCRLHMNKYVPMDNGDLRTIVDEEPKAVIYEVPYAHTQYVGFTKGPVINYTTPGTGPYWDKKMWSIEKNSIIKEVQRAIGGK